MRIGVMGGTFNPPHIGHTHAASAARDGLNLDMLLFVPANLPPHKSLPVGSATGEQRLEMTRIAAESIGAQVCDIEFKRDGKSYTADTLELLKEEYPNADFWLIMGTDMFLTVHSWYCSERIFKCARLAVVAREEDRREAISEHKRFLEENYSVGVDLIEADVLEISSSQLRDGDVISDEFLCPQVLEYIRANGLYEG